MSDSVKEVLRNAAHLINQYRESFEQKPLTEAEVGGYVKLAYRDVAQRLAERGVKNLRIEVDLTVPAGTTVLDSTSTPPLPADFLEPIRAWEKPGGAGNWLPMTQARDHLPFNADQVERLLMYEWRDQAIRLIGSTGSVTVRFHYVGRLADILLPSDTIGLPDLINAVAYRAAELATKEPYFARQATDALLSVANLDTHVRQATPWRRRRLRRAIRIGR